MGIQMYIFVCECVVFPAPFIELVPIFLALLLKISLLAIQGLFLDLDFSSIDLYIFPFASTSFDNCIFVVSFEIGTYESPTL